MKNKDIKLLEEAYASIQEQFDRSLSDVYTRDYEPTSQPATRDILEPGMTTDAAREIGALGEDLADYIEETVGEYNIYLGNGIFLGSAGPDDEMVFAQWQVPFAENTGAATAEIVIPLEAVGLVSNFLTSGKKV